MYKWNGGVLTQVDVHYFTEERFYKNSEPQIWNYKMFPWKIFNQTSNCSENRGDHMKRFKHIVKLFLNFVVLKCTQFECKLLCAVFKLIFCDKHGKITKKLHNSLKRWLVCPIFLILSLSFRQLYFQFLFVLFSKGTSKNIYF